MWNKAEIFEALGGEDLPLLPGAEAPGAAAAGGWRAKQLALLCERAQEYLAQDAPGLPYSLFKLYWETGDRETYQRRYFDRRGRLMTFALLCWLQPEDARWRDALNDIVWAVCAEPFWCMPAHFLGPGDAPLAFDEYAGCLDLFACETAFALAETLALCRAQMAPDVVRQAELQLEKRIFEPFCSDRAVHRFETMHNNWCAVCAGAIGGAALHLVRDRARLANILHRCLSSMDVYLASFGDDGVCVEGVGYWTYGFGFFTCFADLLAKRTAGALDLFALPKVQAIARCQQHYFLSGNCTVSFADGSPTSGFRMGLSCRLQQLVPDAAIPDAVYADSVLSDTCYRFCLSLRDFLWYDEHARFGLPAAGSVWLADAQWLISRGARLVLAAKAGNNGESHNHNDCGSFILCRDGEPLVCDLGAGLYDAGYFGPQRYEYFVNAARSHNVAMPAGCEQAAGAQYAAREVDVFTQGPADVFSAELSGCYACAPLCRYTRTLTHDKAAGTLLLCDALEFETPQPVTQVFLSETPIRLEEGRAVFSRGDAQLALRFDAAHLAASVHTETWREHTQGRVCTAWVLHLDAAPAERHELVLTFD